MILFQRLLFTWRPLLPFISHALLVFYVNFLLIEALVLHQSLIYSSQQIVGTIRPCLRQGLPLSRKHQQNVQLYLNRQQMKDAQADHSPKDA